MPVTSQPDFAHLVIDYAPSAKLVESKSLKLYLSSFRNHGAFHEDCTPMIGQRLAKAIAPRWLRIGGYWYPRGGMPIDVFWQTGVPPKGLWLPEQGRRRGSRTVMSPHAASSRADRPGGDSGRVARRHPQRGTGAGLRRRGLRPRVARARGAARAAGAAGGFRGAGLPGDMGWLGGAHEERADPRTLWPDARTGGRRRHELRAADRSARRAGAARARRSRVYAQGGDYHEVMKTRLKALAVCILGHLPTAT